MPRLEVGDRIIMEGVGTNYNYSTDGSTGTILAISPDGILVHFDYLANRNIPSYVDRNNATYVVNEKYVFLQETFDRSKTSLERKIAFMWERQPYVQRIKQCSGKTDSLSGMS